MMPRLFTADVIEERLRVVVVLAASMMPRLFTADVDRCARRRASPAQASMMPRLFTADVNPEIKKQIESEELQ